MQQQALEFGTIIQYTHTVRHLINCVYADSILEKGVWKRAPTALRYKINMKFPYT